MYTTIGLLGFLCFLLFDVFSLKNFIVGKYVFLVTGIGLIIYSSFTIIQLDATMSIPNTMRYTAFVFAIIFTLLLIFSVFIEVGFNTYDVSSKPQLITNGTYSLVRHPGVIWLFLAYVFYAVYFANGTLLVTAFVWTACNTIYIIVQERMILRKLFQDYDQYSHNTPMIIPTVTSIKTFFTIQNWRNE